MADLLRRLTAWPVRTWHRFASRPLPVRIRTVVVVTAVVAGTAVWVGTAPSSSSSASAAAGPGTTSSSGLTSVSSASTSSRGVTSKEINVVFPVVSLNSLAGKEGFAEDAEFGEQEKAIRLFVGQINHEGGINGRHINAIISFFDPTNESEMRALCKTWTEGSPAAFAVLDGVGTYTGDNELCVTQEGHTPFIGQWTTVTKWLQLGSPYLWWTGPDQAAVLQATVDWGLSSQLLSNSGQVAVVAGNRASDQVALKDYLLPDLSAAGVTPTVITMAADPSETATIDAQAPLVIQQLREKGITSVIPLIPFNVFYPLLAAETSQNYFPRLLLSDYEESIQVALGLIPTPYAQALNGQEGVTTETLGGVDDPRPESQGGYDPGVRSCWTVWHKAYPQIPPGNMSDFLEEQGPVVGWCQAIRLFADAARGAGHDLNRRTFVTAMSRISSYPGTYSPVLAYSPNKRYGPEEYQVVRLHINEPPTSQCKLPMNHVPQVVCWVTVQPFTPLPTPAT
jgi:hypothetical protein